MEAGAPLTRKLRSPPPEHCASILASARDAVIALDLDGNITLWNAAAERLFGYDPAEILGRPIDVLVPPDRRGTDLLPLERIADEAHRSTIECERLSKAGHVFRVSITRSPVYDPHGRLIGVSKIVRRTDDADCSCHARTGLPDGRPATAAAGLPGSARRDHVARNSEHAARIAQLSERQREVLGLIVAGDTNKVIARRLDLSEKTIEMHRTKIMRRLGARNVVDLVRIALTAE